MLLGNICIKDKKMNAPELIAFLDGETSMTETVLLNVLLDYFTSIGEAHIASSLKGLMERASRGNTALLSSGTISSIVNKASMYNYKDDRTKRR